ncbi:MAG: helix-turn-helix domain-containing protein [Gammaproteobacteria bacterium]
MDIKPIKSEGDYKGKLRAIEQLWEAKPDTPESDHLDLLSILVEAFEREHYPIPPPDPIAAIELWMESRGLTRKDREPFIGSRARVSEVMARRRPLTLPVIRRLAVGLEIPTDTLIQPIAQSITGQLDRPP